MVHRSDSTEQRLAETFLLSVLADELGAHWSGTCGFRIALNGLPVATAKQYQY
jgi:hypothetical protein